MKALKILWCAAVAACALLLVVSLKLDAASADIGTQLGQALSSRGVALSTLQTEGTNDLEVVIRCEPGQDREAVWIRALLEEELNRLKYEEKTKAEWVRILIQSQEGKTLLATTQPVEATPPPDSSAVSETDVDQLLAFAREEAQLKSVGVSSMQVALSGRDLVASVAFAVGNGEARNEQLEFVVRQLLPKIREQAEHELRMPIVFYRLSVLATDGQPLLEYVVNAPRSSVRAWMAEGVEPVWAYGAYGGDGTE